MSDEYPRQLFVRIAEPGTANQYMHVGTEVNDVDDIQFDGIVHAKVARYELAGIGSIQHVTPRYVED